MVLRPSRNARDQSRVDVALCQLLGIRPWQTSPLLADDEEPPDWMDNFARAVWRRAYELRQRLVAAAAKAAKTAE
jgi:phage terminase small subunit